MATPPHPLGLLRWSTVLLAALCGAVIGWLVFAWLDTHSGQPQLPAAGPIAVAALAVCVGALAWWAWRQLRIRRLRLDPAQAVALVVLGKAALLAGAFMAGGYLAVAIFNCRRLDASSPRERFIAGLLAAVAGFALAAAGRILEHACHTRPDDDSDDAE